MTKKPDTSATVFRALKILNHLKEVPGPQSIKKISEDLDISTTIIHRLLTTLKLEGFVFQDSQSKLYSLGSLFIEYANKIVTEFPFAPIIEPWLIELRNKTKETVGFYIPNGYSRLCVMEYESKEEIRRTVGVGTKHLIHEGATGRAILGFLFIEYANKIVTEFPFAPIIEPWLIELRNKTKETVGFYIPNGYSRLCVMEYESKEEIRRTVGVGTKHLIHEGATGRAILAFQAPKIQEEILKNLPIDESEKLKDKLSEVEKQGYA